MMSEIIQRLNTYLTGARARLDGASVCDVVIGNQAADLDSMVSAIMYAFLVTGELGEDGVALPVIDIPREDFNLSSTFRISCGVAESLGESPEEAGGDFHGFRVMPGQP